MKDLWRDAIKVKMIGCTTNPRLVLAIAAAKCRGTEKRIGEEFKRLMKSLVENDEGSVIEHVSINFELLGVSTVAMTHITRHRIASHTWGSKRYMKPKGNFILPFKGGEKYLEKIVLSGMSKIIGGLYRAYDYLVDKCKWRKDHARYILPMADTRDGVVTFNLRSLRNFFKKRLHKKAQEEVRYIAWLMLKLVKNHTHIGCIFEDLWEEYGTLYPARYGCNHAFRYMGQIPNTGYCKCMHCGLRKDKLTVVEKKYALPGGTYIGKVGHPNV